MTAETAWDNAMKNLLMGDPTYSGLSSGVFALRAPEKTPLPFATFYREPPMPENTMGSTVAWWTFKVQLKHWSKSKQVADDMRTAAAKLLHCRTDGSYGTTAQTVKAALDAALQPYGWRTMYCAIQTGFETEDTYGGEEVICLGHKYAVQLEALN